MAQWPKKSSPRTYPTPSGNQTKLPSRNLKAGVPSTKRGQQATRNSVTNKTEKSKGANGRKYCAL